MERAREHVEQIRREKFSIGGKPNPLARDLQQAVRNLSAELYAKDVHFLMELIQNAEDNDYLEDPPSLEFIITSEDITATGAPMTLLIFNNEKGFSPSNIESICSVGLSTKGSNRKRGYIGEKGIGFKSVFLVSSQPCIFSNGYQIRFNEVPCRHCNLGYIVPEWVEESPTLSDIRDVYGPGKTLPTTTIVLPLKPDKVRPVKEQLSCIHPEVLLFLSKIKRLSVREHNKDCKLNTISAISIASETDFLTKKNIDAESYTLHLSAEEKNEATDKRCTFYMWKQKFPVKQANKVERRMEAEELVITLAFPFEERLHRGMSSPEVYAFLPTEMVTKFPFIIQADFLLASSRETIPLDNKWNKGILECVPTAFINAFVSLVKNSENAPVSSLAPMFNFIPVNISSYPELNIVRESIKAKLVEENIVTSESYTKQKLFHKPHEVGRLIPAFWNILKKAKNEEVSLHLSSHGRYILSSSFDTQEYDDVLSFLGVELVSNDWYAKCIGSYNLVDRVSEELYLEILLFLADNWSCIFSGTNIRHIPLIKYVGLHGDVSFCSVNECTNWNRERVVFLSQRNDVVSWLVDWNKEFRCVGNRFFMPKSTQATIFSSSRIGALLEWLQNEVKVSPVNVREYAVHLNSSLHTDRKLAVAYVHFLYHSLSKNHLSNLEVGSLCDIMPLVDNYGDLCTQRQGVLVPASISEWVELIGSNPWKGEGYIELAESYLQPGYFAGEFTPREQLLEILKTRVAASDIPYISPPNVAIPAVSSPLTKRNAFLLLDWIRNLRLRGSYLPEKFLKCIKEGSWLKITANGCSGYRPPSESFMLPSQLGNILQNGSVLVDIPLIDRSFYGERINEYKEELKIIGVMFEYEEACEFIGKHLMSLADYSTLSRDNVLSVLNFIRFLTINLLHPVKFIDSINRKRWLRTSCGDRSPTGSVLETCQWTTASQISNIPFLDKQFYGEEILDFKEELQSLGVVTGFCESYELIVDNLKPHSHLSYLTSDAVILILECMRHLGSPNKLVVAVRGAECIKTNLGYKSPEECFLYDPQWGCILQVFRGFPMIDDGFYGSSIFSYRNELNQIGVKVDFEDAVKVFAESFKQQASTMSKETLFSFLSCCGQLKNTSFKFPPDLKKFIREEKWLRTRLGHYRPPSYCILYGPDWRSISPITLLPFVDDTDKYYGQDIHEYRKELKSMGVITELKDGLEFVVDSLWFPHPSEITARNVLTLLECIRVLLQDKNYCFPDNFWKRVSQKWLKTHLGYRPPTECLLFDSNWGLYLERTDGPFVDEEFYGSGIIFYKAELNAIGVTVAVGEGCPLIASQLDFHSEFSTIVRIYHYLSECNWKPGSEASKRIWIPNGSQNGKWVGPGECVLHDKDGLFDGQLQILKKYYDQKLLLFFANAFDVRYNPSVDDYCKMWKAWEDSGRPLSHADCCKFWACVSKHWSGKTEETLVDTLKKLPVGSDPNEILLSNKHDVFIADDLQLKDLFEQSSPQPIFVWYPRQNLPFLTWTKLIEIYRKIGVRTISESVQKEESSSIDVNHLNPVKREEFMLKKGLVRLILGFLADPVRKMEAEKRRETIQGLLNATFFQTVEPITYKYNLSLSSGKIEAKASRMILWDRQSSKIFAQKLDRSAGYKDIIEYATCFSQTISEGLLWQDSDHIDGLSGLIKLGSILEFNEEAIGFLMKSKNLQIFKEDEELLASTFPSD